MVFILYTLKQLLWYYYISVIRIGTTLLGQTQDTFATTGHIKAQLT